MRAIGASVRAGLALAVAAPVMTVHAQSPQALAQIPIYPGAVRDAAAEADWEQEYAARRRAAVAGTLIASTFRAYVVKAPIDDVVKFYQQRFSAREAAGASLDLYDDNGKLRLKTGQASPVTFEAQAHDFKALARDRASARFSEAEAAARLKTIYAKARTPYQPGRWLSSADFTWARRHAEDKITEFRVSLADKGMFDFAVGDVENITSIEIQLDEESESGVEREAEPAEKAPLAEPSAAELGVPRYPGAKYDPRISGEMSSDEHGFYVYATGDALEQVVGFYERATGKKAARQSDGKSSLIAVRGAPPWPELGVSVEPNRGLFGAAVKTVITILRQIEGP